MQLGSAFALVVLSAGMVVFDTDTDHDLSAPTSAFPGTGGTATGRDMFNIGRSMSHARCALFPNQYSIFKTVQRGELTEGRQFIPNLQELALIRGCMAACIVPSSVLSIGILS